MWLLIQQQAYAVPRKSWDLAILLIGSFKGHTSNAEEILEIKAMKRAGPNDDLA